jgi:GNAT superfamily N-acetyltransferase
MPARVSANVDDSDHADVAVHLACPDESSFDQLQSLTALINEAYAIGETGIIGVDNSSTVTNNNTLPLQPFERVDIVTVQTMIAAGQLLVLTTTNNHNNDNANDVIMLGCIKVQVLEERTTVEDDDNVGDYPAPAHHRVGEWGCLAVATLHQRSGLGRLLVSTAEHYLKNELHCSFIQLELLAPSHWEHAHKQMLRCWYTDRLGYALRFTNDYERSTSRLPTGSLLGGKFLLATDADFTCYRKKV